MKPAAFIDRDGTLIEERHYLCDPDGVLLCQGAVEALQELKSRGYWLVLVTNQSGVGRGYYTEEAMHAVHVRLRELLQEKGIELDSIYYCPHVPDEGCDCRKPCKGMVEQACSEREIDLPQSFVIGDKPADIKLAEAVGIPGLLVRTGHGRDYPEDAPEPTVEGETMLEALTAFWGSEAG